MFGYICFYRGKRVEVRALRSYDAQLAAAKIFKARKPYEVAVVLAEDQMGKSVSHSTAEI